MNAFLTSGVLDGVETGIVTTAHDGSITFVNRRARALLRLDSDATGRDVCDVLGLPGRPADLLGAETRRLLSPSVTTRDGVMLDLEVTLSRGDDVEDGRLAFFLVVRDVREDEQREAERRRFERLAAMGTMVAGFAHEVRNPVAALRSIAEELAEELAEAGLALPHVGRMLRVLERMERLVRTSLQFGRPVPPRRAAHRPWTICSSALSSIAPRTMTSKVDLRVDMQPELPDVFVDDGQLVQALVVLLDNALDAQGSSGVVTLRVTSSRAAVSFEVIDDGPGIAPADLSRIFDPFFTTKASGTGLGLSIAQRIVRENGGRLEVTSPAGGPTTFTIVIGSTADAP